MIELEDYESFDEAVNAQSISSKHKALHEAEALSIRKLTQISIEMRHLESYMAKRKDLKERHTNALLKLHARLQKN